MSAVDALKLLGGPGSLRFLALGFLAGLVVIVLRPRYRTVARVWLLTLFSIYLVLALPVVAHGIAAPFSYPSDSASVERVRPVDLLVVFDGDNFESRVRTSAQAWRQLTPAAILVSGEPWFIKRLTRAGLPADRLITDTQSTTTRDQLTYLEAYLQAHPFRRPAVIVSRLQAPRVVALLRARGLVVLVIPAPVDAEPPSMGLRTWLPSYAALRLSRDALYERVAIPYYRWRGWIR